MRPQVFKLEKTLKIAKYIKDAVVLGWGRQILKNSSETIGIKSVTIRACRETWSIWNTINLKIFETIPEIFWPSRFRSDEQFTSFNDLRLSTFLRELFTVEQITVYPGKYSQRLVTIRAKCGLRSQALYFLYLSHPPETGKGGKRSYDRTTKSYVLWYLAYFSWEVQTTTSDSH